MYILLSNDDGIRSPGLKALAEALGEIAEVRVVAPDRERSAAGHSLTLNRPLRIEEVEHNWYAVDGTPTDCINIAIHGIFKEAPALVFSGINHGENLGDDVTYSGTVSAALEGMISGIPSVAVSLAMRHDYIFEPAARFSARVAQMILDRGGLPENTLLNINYPNISKAKPRGVRITHQGKRRYGDIIVEKTDPRGKKYYWIGGEVVDYDKNARSDIMTVANGFISITPLHIDMTNHSCIEQLRTWDFNTETEEMWKA
jgi:5'/3'-nucleotidase